VPTALGVNAMSIVQVALAGTALVQVLEARAKSPAFNPVRITELTFKVALPLFVTVTTTGALVAPWLVLGSIMGLLGATVTAGIAGARPLPLRARICGLLEAPVNCKLARRSPVLLGAKATPTVQVPFAAIVTAVQVLDVIAKSVGLAPVMETLLMWRGAPPLLVTVMEIGALAVPAATSGKSMGLAGAKPTTGVGPRVQLKIF
jgi:hypothetical protein